MLNETTVHVIGPLFGSEEFTWWITFLIVAAALYLCCKLTVYLIRTSVKQFEKNKKVCKAEVVGYHASHAHTDNGSYFQGYKLCLKVFDLEDEYEWVASAIPYPSKSIYPIGTIVTVEYAERKIFGKHLYYEVYVNGVRYNDEGNAKGFDIAAKISFVATMFCLVGAIIAYAKIPI